jgi:hypothetical protein
MEHLLVAGKTRGRGAIIVERVGGGKEGVATSV